MMGWLFSATVVAGWLIFATRWFGSDRRDDDAVRSHQHALERLRHADGNLGASSSDDAPSAQAHVRLLPPRRGGTSPSLHSPPTPPANPPERRVERPAITEPAPQPDPVRPAPEGLADLLPLRAPRRRRALALPRWTRLAVAAVLVVALVAVAAIIVSNVERDDSPASTTADEEAEPTPTTPSSEPEPDPPPVPAVQLTGFDGQTASYVVSGNSLAVSLAATAPCWMEVSSSADEVVFQGTVPAGGEQTFQDPAGLVLRLGNPTGIGMQVNGAPLPLPPEAQEGAPIDVDVRTEASLAAPSAPPDTIP